MPRINKSRQVKQMEEAQEGELDEWGDAVEHVVKPEKEVRRLALKRTSKTTDLSTAKVTGEAVVGGVEGGIIGGERKESVRTIERGGTRGGEGEEEGAGVGLDKMITVFKRKTELSLKRRIEKHGERKPAPPSIERIWFILITEKYHGIVPPLWDVAHRALTKALLKRLGNERSVEVIRWAVANWEGMLQTKFSWMTRAKPPSQPSFTFFYKFVHTFMEAMEETKDAPLQIEHVVKGLNLARKAVSNNRPSNTPPQSQPKPVLLKKDLGTTVKPSPRIQEWRD